jgi:Putative adhesin
MEPRIHRFPVGAGPYAVEVRNPAGSVTVEAVEDAPEYVVEIEALNAAAEELIDRVDLFLVGSRLRVHVPERRLQLRSPAFAIRVTAPLGTAARVAVASADVELRGELGRVELTGASGDSLVESCADLQLRSASGDARVGTVTGRTTVGSASGDLRIESVGGGLEVKTASGDVEVGSAGGDVSITTASGDVGIARATGGTVGVKTVSGDVEVGVVPGLRVWLDLSSISGRMTSQLDGDDAATGNDPAQLTVAVRTVSGDLRVRPAPVS